MFSFFSRRPKGVLGVSAEQVTHITHTTYRPDVDGLRAIAILAVMLFHAFPGAVTGGFVGVDVFFVISGYLISLVIFKERAQGRFSILKFYQRRVRRIFPALFVVLATCLAVGWFTLLPDEYMPLGKNTAGGAGFVANFLYWKESGYFDVSADVKPLLHLWTLGIEEQFYIVWPLLLMLVWRRKAFLPVLTVGLLVASFAFNAARIGSDPVATFYLPGSRFWELLIGSALAASVFLGKDLSYRLRPRVLSTMAACGLVLILAAVFGLKKADAFPGWWALLPTVGAFFMIGAGPRAWVNKKLLANRFMVFVGLISFPLYLWHWPLLSFARILWSGAPPQHVILIALALAVVLAWLTYMFVEKPLRFGGHAAQKTAALCLGVILVGVAGFAVHKKGGVPDRAFLSASEEARLNANAFHWLPGQGQSCLERVNLTEEPKQGATIFCHLDPFITNPSVAIIGDSMSDHFYPGFSKLFERYGHGVIQVGMSSCNPFNGMMGTRPWNKACEQVNRKIYDYLIKNKDIKTVILTFAAWDIQNMAFHDVDMRAKPAEKFAVMEKLAVADMAALKAAGKTVIAAFDLPAVGTDPRSCVPLAPFRTPNCHITTTRVQALMEPYLSNWKRIFATRKEVCIFDQDPLFRKGETYVLVKDRKLLYRDDHHLTVYGSDYVADSFAGTDCFRKALAALPKPMGAAPLKQPRWEDIEIPLTQNTVEAPAALRRKAEDGFQEAQFAMGSLCLQGQGEARNPKQALMWYRKSAEQLYSPAQDALGDLYRRGTDVPQDFEEARRWYLRAADLNFAPSQNSLGDMYRDGSGVAKDAAQAAKWYRKAAENGFAPAQNALGNLYRDGLGVPKDIEQAKLWFRKAADQKNASAKSALEALAAMEK